MHMVYATDADDSLDSFLSFLIISELIQTVVDRGMGMTQGWGCEMGGVSGSSPFQVYSRIYNPVLEISQLDFVVL